jgi:hypothetical protein
MAGLREKDSLSSKRKERFWYTEGKISLPSSFLLVLPI